MTTSSSLAIAIAPYDKALDALEAGSPSQEQVLNVLLARDIVEVALQDTASIPSHQLMRLDDLDRKLKAQRSTITKTIKLRNWRNIHHPPATNWWWYFEPPALLPCLDQPHPLLDQLDWLWQLIILVALAISVTFILNTLKRVLSGGVDTAGVSAVVLQSVLALAGGSALTQQGRAALESSLKRLRIPKHYWQELGAFLSIAVLLLVMAIHTFYLPQLATNLNKSGQQNYESGQLDSALSNYQQAIALRPDYAEAHYHLGTLYEDLQKTDQAIAEYQLVVQSDLNSQPNSPERLLMLRAHNNLGRLYLLKGNTQAAWAPLEQGLGFVDADAAIKNADIQYEHYKLLKNLGWVRLQQKYYLDAANYFQEAIDLQPQLQSLFAEVGGQAAPFCLQAQVLEAQKQNKAAQTAWETCVQ